MSISIRKGFAVICVIVMLIAALAGCAKEPEDPQQAMKEAYAKQYIVDGCKAEDLSVDYFGEYEGCHVGYIGGFFAYTTALEYEEIGSVKFCFPSSDRPWVYRDGKLMQLSAAYEAGWLSDEAIGQIHKDHFEK